MSIVVVASQADPYTSGVVVGVVATAAFAGLTLLNARGALRQAGVVLLLASCAWCAGIVLHPRWLGVGVVLSFGLSHQLRARVKSMLGQSRRGVERKDGSAPTPDTGPPVSVTARPDEYDCAVAEIEVAAHDVLKTLQRLNTVFKSEEFAGLVARERYGHASEMRRAYVAAHRARRRAFFDKLNDGELRHREICSLRAIEAAVLAPQHPGVEMVPREMLVDQVRSVVDTLRRFPEGYSLGLSEAHLPLRYAVFDANIVVIHEAIGPADIYRINSLFIREPDAVLMFRDEFEFVWEQIPRDHRENDAVAEVLESMLERA
jgi:hypothetical protein